MAARLFDDAGQLLTAGRIAEACPKYAESQRLDPQLGTLLHLADCYVKVGKSASAWASFKDAQEIAHGRSDPREAKIAERIAALEKSLSTLTITIADATPNLEVRQDGALVGKAAWGSPSPIDPGPHAITVRAPGKKPWTGSVEVAAGPTAARVDVPVLEAEPNPPATADSTATNPATNPPPPTDANAASPVGSEPRANSRVARTQTIAGYSLIGAGVVGLGVGLVFAIQHSSKLNDRDSVCPSGVCPQAELGADQAKINQLTSEARSAGTVSTVGFVAGGLLAAGGVALVVIGHRHTEGVAVSPWVGPRLSGVALSGSIW
jgi:hypothetical protein